MLEQIRLWYDNINKSGSIAILMEIAKKYDLHGFINKSIENDTYVTKYAWKQMVCERVRKVENYKMNLKISMYKSLNMMNLSVPKNRLWPWWQYASQYPCKYKKCRVLAKLMLMPRYVYENNCYMNGICVYCETSESYDLAHFLFTCKKYNECRNKEWSSACERLPIAFRNSFTEMTAMEKTIFILSGLNTNFMEEFRIIYDALLEFVFNMYAQNIQNIS